MGKTCIFCEIFVLFFIYSLNPNSVNAQIDPTVKLSKAVNCFTVDLYKQLIVGQDNVVCSPYSADVVLSMLLVGAGGNTADEINQALGYTDKQLSLSDVESAFKTDLSSQTSSDGNTLNVSNSLWIQSGNQILPGYENIVTQDFYASVKSLDFAHDPQGSTNTINNWVNNQTRGLIPILFDSTLPTSTFLVLINTIYFNGTWKNQFDKTDTQNSTFFNNGQQNDKVLVSFMNQQNTFKYREDGNLQAQVLEMDYVGGGTSMTFILPYQNSSLTALETALNCTYFEDGFQTSTTKLVEVIIPLFNVTSSFNLIPPLENLGIKTVFDSEANLTGISNRAQVSKVVQKAVIKVNEKGTEAAAATGATVTTSAIGPPSPPPQVIFEANRPFLYFIRHNLTNVILFIGRVQTLGKP